MTKLRSRPSREAVVGRRTVVRYSQVHGHLPDEIPAAVHVSAVAAFADASAADIVAADGAALLAPTEADVVARAVPAIDAAVVAVDLLSGLALS